MEPSRRRRATSALPPGTLAIGRGLVINGLCTYGFLIVAARAVGDDAYGALAVTWALVYILGPGLLQPLEQELARATAARAANGDGSAPVMRQAIRVGFAAFVVICVALVAAWPLGLSSILDGRLGLLFAVIFGLGGFAIAEVSRGILSGRQLFDEYARYFAFEGASRMLLTFALLAVGIEIVDWYAAAIGAAFVIGAAGGVYSVRPLVNPGPPSKLAEITPSLGLLLATSIAEAFLLNVGPVAVSIVGNDLGDDAPGVFLNGMIVARIPLFFFQAVKATMLPSLTAKATEGDMAGFRSAQLRLLAVVVAVGATSTLIMALVGPQLISALFDDELTSTDMALLAASGSGLMLMLSLSIGLVALHKTRQAVIGFVVSILGFPVGLQMATEPFIRVELGLLTAVVAGSVVMGGLLQREFVAPEETPTPVR